jgi:hypothetical protein
MSYDRPTKSIPAGSEEDLANRFLHHAPHGDQAERYEIIRETALSFAKLILDETPRSREQSLAFTALEEAVMWANAAIARNEAET